MNHFLKSTGKKLTLGFVVTISLYAIYSIVIFNTVYNEWDYVSFDGKVFSFDVIRYVSFLLTLALVVYVIGYNFKWKYILVMLAAQIIGYIVFYYFLYIQSGKVHYIGDTQSIIKVNHDSFLEWLDYLIGVRRWAYTRLVELMIFAVVVYLSFRIPKPKWSLLNRTVYNSTYTSLLDQSSNEHPSQNNKS